MAQEAVQGGEGALPKLGEEKINTTIWAMNDPSSDDYESYGLTYSMKLMEGDSLSGTYHEEIYGSITKENIASTPDVGKTFSFGKTAGRTMRSSDDTFNETTWNEGGSDYSHEITGWDPHKDEECDAWDALKAEVDSDINEVIAAHNNFRENAPGAILVNQVGLSPVCPLSLP